MGRKKILIVDDEKDTLLVLEKQLTTAGYDVITADNGQHALLMAKSQQPDLIVLDVQMQDMEGGEIAFRLKGNPTTKDIPVVFLTCLLSSSESVREGHHCGGHIMLAKSDDTKELIDVIEQVLCPV
jgi:CheY-like chemotaxis protein